MRTTIKFWGVRGSLARPSAGALQFGGNTPCVEIRHGKELIICDSGTGIYDLGRSLAKNRPAGGGIRAAILYSHYHWDHIIGLPFFAPIYGKKNAFTIIGRRGLKRAITKLLSPPNFPVSLKDFKARLNFMPRQNCRFRIGRIVVEAFNVNHPNGASGYSFILPNKRKIVFISDSGPIANYDYIIARLSKADVLIHDAQFTLKEYVERRRFGHSPYQYVLDVAGKAGVKRIFLFHHDPSRTDAQLKRLENEAKRLAKKIGLSSRIEAAREGTTLNL